MNYENARMPLTEATQERATNGRDVIALRNVISGSVIQSVFAFASWLLPITYINAANINIAKSNKCNNTTIYINKSPSI